MSCSYSPTGIVPADKEYPTAVRSKNITACKISADTLEVNNDLSVGNDVTIGNNLSVINTTTTDKLIVNQDFFEPGNVRYYGAVGDGVTDDTAAFQQALAEVDCIRVPPGDYVISSTISIGEGQGITGCSPVSVKLLSSADTIVQFTGPTSYINNISLEYTGANMTTSIGVEIIDGLFSVIINNIRIEITNAPAFGIILRDSDECRISNSVVWSQLIAVTIDGRANTIYSSVIHVQQNTSNILQIDGRDINCNNVTVKGSGTALITQGVTFSATSSFSSFIAGAVIAAGSSTITTNIADNGASNIVLFSGAPYRGLNVPLSIFVGGTQVVTTQQAAIADLNQTITNPPTQAEVQAISDKIDELLAALRAGTGHGLIAA